MAFCSSVHACMLPFTRSVHWDSENVLCTTDVGLVVSLILLLPVQCTTGWRASSNTRTPATLAGHGRTCRQRVAVAWPSRRQPGRCSRRWRRRRCRGPPRAPGPPATSSSARPLGLVHQQCRAGRLPRSTRSPRRRRHLSTVVANITLSSSSCRRSAAARVVPSPCQA
jgi:hypothetical protein